MNKTEFVRRAMDYGFHIIIKENRACLNMPGGNNRLMGFGNIDNFRSFLCHTNNEPDGLRYILRDYQFENNHVQQLGVNAWIKVPETIPKEEAFWLLITRYPELRKAILLVMGDIYVHVEKVEVEKKVEVEVEKPVYYKDTQDIEYWKQRAKSAEGRLKKLKNIMI